MVAYYPYKEYETDMLWREMKTILNADDSMRNNDAWCNVDNRGTQNKTACGAMLLVPIIVQHMSSFSLHC